MAKEDCGKLDDTISIRIPRHLKVQFDKLPLEKKHVALHNLRLEIAKAVHSSKFNPSDYLVEGE